MHSGLSCSQLYRLTGSMLTHSGDCSPQHFRSISDGISLHLPHVHHGSRGLDDGEGGDWPGFIDEADSRTSNTMPGSLVMIRSKR